MSDCIEENAMLDLAVGSLFLVSNWYYEHIVFASLSRYHFIDMISIPIFWDTGPIDFCTTFNRAFTFLNK